MASVADSDYGIGFELYEMLPDAIVAVDQQGVIRYANRQAGRLFGQEPAALVATQVEALLPEHLRKRHLAHRAKYNLEPRRRPMGRGLDLVARRADGTTFPVDIMLNPLTHLREPMTLAVVRDMTDLRALEDALRQARTAFEKFYEQPPDGTIMVDESGKIDRVTALTCAARISGSVRRRPRQSAWRSTSSPLMPANTEPFRPTQATSTSRGAWSGLAMTGIAS